MVAVCAHPSADVALVPCVEEVGVAIPALAGMPGLAPLVEHLVFHKKAEFVAKLQQLFARRIVRRPDGVHARFLHQQKAALHRGAVPRRAEDAEIVVD